MNSKTAKQPSVLSTTQRSKAEGDQLNVFYRLERESIKPLLAMLDTLFEQLGESFFQSANSASDQKEQNDYFSFMKELREKRGHAHTRFRHYLTQNFRSLIKSEKQLWKSSVVDLYGIEDFQIEVSINNIVTRTRCSIPGPLLYLLTRLNALFPETRISATNNPLDPKQIVTAFILAVAPLKFDTQLRLLLLKKFELLLLSTLRLQVERANALLVRQGYCPDIDPESIRHTRLTVPQQTQKINVIQTAEKSLDNYTDKSTENDASSRPEKLASEKLISKKLTPEDFASKKLPAKNTITDPLLNYPPISKTKLIRLIDFLQRCQLKKPLSIFTLQAQPLIEHLLTSSAAPYERQSISTNDKKIILILDTTFQFLYSQNLPTPLLALILKLQLPLLKVALQDPGFLTNRLHPARQLINALTTTGTDWSRTNNDILQKGTHFIVERLSDELYGDPQLFQQLASSLIKQQKNQTARALKIETRVIQSEQGIDKVEHTRNLVNQLLSDRLQGKRIHPQCKDFLLGIWQRILFQYYLKHGESSPKTRDTLTLTQQLIALSCGNATTHADPFDTLTGTLRQKLREANMGEQQITQQIEELQAAIDDIEIDGPQTPHSLPIHDQIIHEPDTIVDYLSQRELESLDTLLYSDLLKQAQHLAPGTWFQFTSTDHQSSLCKLSAQLPLSGNLLFTYANGQKANIISQARFATQLYKSEAVPIHQAPLLDRALRYAANTMRSELAFHSTD